MYSILKKGSNTMEFIDNDVDIDIITLIKGDAQKILLVPREDMYQIDKEYWETVVDSGAKGYLFEKVIILDDNETFSGVDTAISALTSSKSIHELITTEDIIPTLRYLSRFIYQGSSSITNTRKALTRILLDLSPEKILSIWHDSCASFIDSELLHDKVRTWDDSYIRDGGWVILLSFPKTRPIYVDRPYQISIYCWFWIRAYEYGYVQRLPTLPDNLSDEYWNRTPKSVHGAMRKSLLHVSTITKITTCTIKKIISEICNCDISQFCRISCSVLQSLNCDEITSIMFCVLKHMDILYEKAGSNLTFLLETAKNVLRGEYTDMNSSLSRLEILLIHNLSKIRAEAWDVYMICHTNREKRLAALHPLSYSFVIYDSWYDSYIEVIRQTINRPIIKPKMLRSIPL